MEAFSLENRQTYLKEAISSLNGLLDDAFLGDDQNEIRSEFPENCKREDITIENTKVSLAFLNESEDALIEIAIQITLDGALLGEYKSVYSANGELEDEFFTLD